MFKKYLKYKAKYLSLKKSQSSNSSSLDMIGGDGGYFKENTAKFYIMADIVDKDIIARLDERRKLLLNNKLPTHNMLHLTLLQMDVNKKHKLYTDFEKSLAEITVAVGTIYKDTFKKEQAKLKYVLGLYDLLGQTANKFLSKIYELYDKNKLTITNFRKAFYQYLKSLFSVPYNIVDDTKTSGFALFKFGDEVLFAVPAFYYGIGVWTPHISIVNTGDVATHNKDLYAKYVQQKDKLGQMNALLEPVYKARFNPIGDIDMEKHIGSVTVSLAGVAKTASVA